MRWLILAFACSVVVLVAAKTEEPAAPEYELYNICYEFGSNFAVRLRATTGEAWMMHNDHWHKIREVGPIDQGTFAIESTFRKLVPEANNTDISVMRVNCTTGKAWTMRLTVDGDKFDRRWDLVPEND